MIALKDRQDFLAILSELRISDDYPAFICVYKLLSKLISNCQGNVHQILAAGYTNRFRTVPGIDWMFPGISHFADKLASPMLEVLCRIMHRYNLHDDYSRFFLVFAPGMAANWHTLRALDTEERPIIDVLYWHFVVTSEITHSEAALGCSYGDFYDQMHQHLPSLQAYEYELIWDAVTFHQCATPNMQSPRVTKAVNLFAAQGKSKQDLLESYLLEQRDLGKTPICYAELSTQELQKVAIGKFPTDDDVNYHTAPMYINLERPHIVLANLYDYKKEIPFGESVMAFDAFISRLHMASTPLMINPNPHILEMWLSLSKDDTELPQLSVAMPSRGIALALSRRYPQVHFFGVEELMSEPITADLVLLYGTDVKKEKERKSKKNEPEQARTKLAATPKLTDLFSCVQPAENCVVVACINTQAITAKRPNLCALLSSKGLQISQMTSIPADKGLKGRIKKISTMCIIAGSVQEVDPEAQIPVYDCMATKARDYFSVFPLPWYISLINFNCGRTITQILSQHVGASTGNETGKNRAVPLPWSKEIVVRYSVFDGSTAKGAYVRAKAYIQRMDPLNPDGYRKAIPKTQREKGLRAKTKGDLITKLADFPLQEEFYQPVLEEVIRMYGHCPELLTIKTVWFCVRPLLNQKRFYEDDLAKELFCGENQALSNLTLHASYEEYCESLNTVLGTNAVSMKYWAVLWQISAEAVENGFISKDPFSAFAPVIEATTRQKVYPIQDALRKWTFNDDEMNQMVQPLLAPLPSGHPLFETDSHAFLKLCALFSFVRKAELCALTVGNIEFLPNGGVQATITRFVDEKGEICEYAKHGRNRRQRRKTVWPPFLAECLKHRLKYLQDRFKWDNEAMKEMPLFFEDEPSYKAAKVKPCSLQTATRLFKELLDSAKVPSDWIQLLDGNEARDVNFGLSRKTEYNFFNSTRILSNYYGLEDGEVSYNDGTEAEVTIDTNYIGYDAPHNQIRTSAKMHRMSARFLRQIAPCVRDVPRRYSIRNGDDLFQKVIEAPADKCINLSLEILPESDVFQGPITVRIQSRFGHQNKTTVFGGDEHDYHEE